MAAVVNQLSCHCNHALRHTPINRDGNAVSRLAAALYCINRRILHPLHRLLLSA